MKQIGLLILLQLLVFSTFSQLQISGKVTDESGLSLPGANVIILRSGNSSQVAATVTNAKGYYTISDLPSMKVDIQVSFVGFEKAVKTVQLNENSTFDFRLQERNLLSEEVLVKASKVSPDMPLTYTSIDKEKIQEDLMAQDIPYLLSMTPGLVETSETGIGIGYTGLRIRGTDPTRINVMIDGIPLNDAESHTVYWVDLPDFSSSVEEIQVTRGVGTSMNGAAAFGGSINLETSRLNESPYASISSQAGSFNTFKNAVQVGSGLINERFTVDARYSVINACSYIQHGYSNLESFFLSAAYHGKKSLVKANIIHGKEKTGITWWGTPDYMIDSIRNYNPAGVYYDKDGIERYHENQTDNYTQTHYQLHYSQELHSDLVWNTSLHYTRGGGYYEQFMDDANSYHSSYFSEYGLPDFTDAQGNVITQSDMIRQKWVVNDYYGFTSNLNYSKNDLDLTAGLSMNRYDGTHYGIIKWMEFNMGVSPDFEWYRNLGQKDEASGFVRLNYQILNKLSAFADVQYRTIHYSMEGPDDDFKVLDQEHTFHFINPKGGLRYEINKKQSVYASYSVANREPTRADFKEAVGDADATPLPERLYDLEIGYSNRWEKGMIGLNLFHMNYYNQLVPTGEKSNVGYDIMTNVENSYRMGIELSGGVNLLSNLNWEGNLSLSKNRIKNFVEYAAYYDVNWNEYYLAKDLGETHLSYSPEVIANSRFKYDVTKDFSLSFVSKYVGEQYFDNTSSEDRKLDAYHTHNLLFNYRMKTKSIKQIDFQLQIRNIFNQEYIVSAYGGNWYENADISQNNVVSADELTWAYYFPQAGIQFYGGITISF